MNRFRISTPEGTRDLLFSSCRALRQTENAVRDALEERGYSEIITPAVEYFDVFAQANPELDQDQMLKIIDKSGRICVARPDNTTPIARIAATRLDDAALPGPPVLQPEGVPFGVRRPRPQGRVPAGRRGIYRRGRSGGRQGHSLGCVCRTQQDRARTTSA